MMSSTSMSNPNQSTNMDEPDIDGWNEEEDEDYCDDTVDMTDCGMHYDDGFNFACDLIGSEQCEFCPNRR